MTEPETDLPSVVAVLGSVTPPGRLHRAVSEALHRVGARGAARTRLIDLAAMTVAFADGRPPEELEDDTAGVIAALSAADAVVLATPIYRGTLTGALKNLLDHVPVATLRDTPVGIVSMGATHHHSLGAESHLRDVLAWFGALTAPTAVYLASADFEEGWPKPPADERLDGLLQTLITLAACVGGEHLGPPPLAAGRG